jgi:hypothetical protein
MLRTLLSDEKMPKQKVRSRKKIVAEIISVLVVIAIVLATVPYLYPPEKLFYSEKIFPGETYVAWGGNSAPFGYVFREIRYDMYLSNGSLIYGSGTLDTSWTCPAYVYGQEGKSGYKVYYALAWTEANSTVPVP